MQAFLYLDLTVAEQPVSYQQAELKLVKTRFPHIALLDLDAASDEMLVHYAKRMMQESEQLAVCIIADKNASFRNLTTLLEDLLQADRRQLILLRGESQRLQRILEARPQLRFKQIGTGAELLNELEQFYV